MKTKITSKDRIRSSIDKLINNTDFITWEMLGVTPYTKRYHLTYEGKIVFDYMSNLNIKYLSYSEVSNNKCFNGNKKGFYVNIILKRKLNIDDKRVNLNRTG
jgi:hypothetical protein